MEVIEEPYQDVWRKGTVGPYEWEAKVYDVGSQYGIGGGRVSKLWLYRLGPLHKTTCPIGITRRVGAVAVYDRGWDKRPRNARAKAAVEAVVAYFDGKCVSLDKGRVTVLP